MHVVDEGRRLVRGITNNLQLTFLFQSECRSNRFGKCKVAIDYAGYQGRRASYPLPKLLRRLLDTIVSITPGKRGVVVWWRKRSSIPDPEESTARDAIFILHSQFLSTYIFYPSVHSCHAIAAESRAIHDDDNTVIIAYALIFMSYTKSPAPSPPDDRLGSCWIHTTTLIHSHPTRTTSQY